MLPLFRLDIQPLEFNGRSVFIYVPNKASVKDWYLSQKGTDGANADPYWAKLWPAAIGLSQFLVTNLSLIQQKTVLELAGGLGLPSLVAAPYAKEVLCSDYMPAAIEVVRRSMLLNGYENVTAKVLNWNDLPPDTHADVLLLSDINYDPQVFGSLYQVLHSFLEKGTTVLLSTPQRLVAKDFIGPLLRYCIQQEEREIHWEGEQAFVSLFVLKKNRG
ncbi:MAG: hypothetical protein JWP69_45 [Flaviaesturariibacter sp.]|nr:hypothetical protein [Flaviaesturariibacter sp.]